MWNKLGCRAKIKRRSGENDTNFTSHKRHVSLRMIFIGWNFQPPEAPQESNYEFTSQTRFAAHPSSRFSGRSVDRARESGGNRAYVQPVETIKTENRKWNSKLLQDNPIYGWQCCSVRRLAVWLSLAARFRGEYKTSGTQCLVQATAGKTPMVSADRCVNCSQRAGIVTWNSTKTRLQF